MGAFDFSLGAGGMSDELQEMLKQKFLEQIQQQTLAQQAARDASNAEYQQGSLDVSRGNLDQRRAEFEAANAPKPPEAPKPLVVGGRIVDPQTFKVLYEPPAQAPAPQRPISLAPGARLVDPVTGKLITSAPDRPSASGGGPARIAQAGGAAPPVDQKAQAEANEVQQTIDLIRQIQSDKALPSAVGAFEGRGLGRVTGSNDDYERVSALHDQLVGRLQLAQAGKLKGQGQVSDREREMLMKAATALRRTLSDTDYQAELGKILSQFEGMGKAAPAPAAPASDAAARAAELLKKYGG